MKVTFNTATFAGGIEFVDGGTMLIAICVD